VIQIAFGYGLFHRRLRSALRRGALGPRYPDLCRQHKRQIQIMQDFRPPPGLHPQLCPDHRRHLLEMGINPNGLSLRVGLFGPSMVRSHAPRDQRKTGITALDNYGLSEIMGPGVAGECQECNGLHINEDHFLVEVIDR